MVVPVLKRRDDVLLARRLVLPGRVIDRVENAKSRAQPGGQEFGLLEAQKRLELATNRGPQTTPDNVGRETALLPLKATRASAAARLPDRP
jgi:hypothetical protein